MGCYAGTRMTCSVDDNVSPADKVECRVKVSVKENELPTEKNSSRASIFATKASYISN